MYLRSFIHGNYFRMDEFLKAKKTDVSFGFIYKQLIDKVSDDPIVKPDGVCCFCWYFSQEGIMN